MRLPPGFVLEQPEQNTAVSLPPGFVLESAPAAQPQDPLAARRAREVPSFANIRQADAMPTAREPSVMDRLAAVPGAAVSAASSVPAFLMGTGAGVYEAATSPQFGTQEAIRQGQRKMGEVMDRFTYTPSAGSQALLQDVGQAIEPLKAAPVMPMGMGAPGSVRAGLQGTRAAAGAEADLVKNAFRSAVEARKAESMAAKAEKSFARGPQIDAAKDAQRLGIALAPSISNPTKMNKMLALSTDPTELHNTLSEANLPKYASVAKKEMGLSDREALTSSAPFDKARALAAKPYDKIREIEVLQSSDDVIQKIKDVIDEDLIGGVTSQNQIQALIDDAVKKISGGITGARAIDNISNLRKKSQKVYNSKAATPEQVEVADARMTIANALEDLIEKNVTDQKLLAEFRKARTQMAKTYAYERATDFNTGNIDIQKLAKLTSQNDYLTGDIAALGRIAGNYPEVTQMRPVVASPIDRFTRAGVAGTLGAGVGGAIFGGPGVIGGGAAGALAGRVLSRSAAKRLTSPEKQASRAIPRDYRSEPDLRELARNKLAPDNKNNLR